MGHWCRHVVLFFILVTCFVSIILLLRLDCKFSVENEWKLTAVYRALQSGGKVLGAIILSGLTTFRKYSLATLITIIILVPLYMLMAASRWLVKEEFEDRDRCGARTFRTLVCSIVGCHLDEKPLCSRHFRASPKSLKRLASASPRQQLTTGCGELY